MKRMLTVLTVMAAAVAGCGDGGDGGAGGEDASVTTTTAGRRTTSTAGEPPAAVAAPEYWVGHDADHRLVVVETESEAVRPLAEFDDPAAFGDEGEEPVAGGSFLGSFTVSPDRKMVYYERCCEPAPGVTFRVPVEGGERASVTEGAFPAVSPDGSRLALVELQWVKIVDLRTDEVTRLKSSGQGPSMLAGLAWSPDGRHLVFERYDTLPEGAVMALEVQKATSLDDAVTVAEADDDGTPTLPTFDDEGRLHVVYQEHRPPGGYAGPATAVVVGFPSGQEVSRRALTGAVVSQDHDDSGQYLIRTFDDGTVRAWSAGGQPIRLGDGYLGASW